MKKSSTESFVVTRRLILEPWQYDRLEKKMDAANRLYNAAVKHCLFILGKMREDEDYKTALADYREPGKKAAAKKRLNEIREAYGLTEYGIHAYIGEGYRRSYKGCLGINIVQKLGTELSKAVDGAIFKETKIRFRKRGETVSFEDKKSDSGIIYKPEDDAVYIKGQRYRIKPVRKSDRYMAEAMTHRVKYCRVVRKPFRGGYRYFVQFVMEGEAPVKDKAMYPGQIHAHGLGFGNAGVDEGTSDVAWYEDESAGFEILADGVEKYNAEIRECAKIYERRTRINNPDCYKSDGTRIKGKKNYRHTKGMLEALMWLKNAYRKKSAFVRERHNILANRIISGCDVIIKEPMDFSGMAKRSGKKAERREKASVVVNKKGEAKTVHKFKKKKRFGRSVNDRSPGLFNKTLEEKITRLGGRYINVVSTCYKASQYNHLTGEAVKSRLSERTKQIGDNIVQRDLYSAFLLYEAKDETIPDFKKCGRDFKDFLIRQGLIIKDMIRKGDRTKNFGLKTLLKEQTV